ncbi:MAG: glycerate kinase [Planctomycetes bacterium]|nr:glycerate kinase [Planctomycetota bacterium]
MKILVAPDKFKDALAAPAVAEAIAAGIRDALPDAEVDCCPLADGGDGSGPILAHALRATLRRTTVHDPLSRPIQASWWHIAGTNTALIEMAQASGLQRLAESERTAARATSFGTGQLIREAIAAGCARILLCIGGSASVDGGAGCLQALGWTLIDRRGNEITKPASGASLADVERIQPPESPLPSAIEVLCDVDNPLCGPRGAAEVFAAQKGATPPEVAQLSTALTHWAGILRSATGCDVSHLQYGGAAGGLSAALSAACSATLTSGFDKIAALVHLPKKLERCRLCLTGEGRIDSQTAGGKTVAGVARMAMHAAVPVIALAGQVQPDPGQSPQELAKDIGLSAIHLITPAHFWLPEALRDTYTNLRRAASDCVRKID